jgi:hypothetical protein
MPACRSMKPCCAFYRTWYMLHGRFARALPPTSEQQQQQVMFRLPKRDRLSKTGARGKPPHQQEVALKLDKKDAFRYG